MSPGLWVKDGSDRGYIDVERVEGFKVYGKQFLKTRTADGLGTTYVPLDSSTKIWFKDLHSWGEFYFLVS